MYVLKLNNIKGLTAPYFYDVGGIAMIHYNVCSPANAKKFHSLKDANVFMNLNLSEEIRKKFSVVDYQKEMIEYKKSKQKIK